LPLEQITAGKVFVAEWNGSIVGFAVVEPRVDGESELDGLFVDSNIRRRGIGRLLIEHCAKIVRTQKSVALKVVGNPREGLLYRLRLRGNWKLTNPFWRGIVDADDGLTAWRRR
jgi:GNAT superfamily N-acetyltransferase